MGNIHRFPPQKHLINNRSYWSGAFLQIIAGDDLNTVQPIRDKELIEDIKEYLFKKSKRDYVLFCTGIYLPLRISDLLKLKVRDVRGKKEIYLRVKKTKKEIILALNPTLISILDNYCKDKNGYDFLFPSRKRSKSKQKAISRQQALNIIHDIGYMFDVENIGCHTLRKTFGYHHYKKYKDIKLLGLILGQANEKSTAHYIGISQDMINESIRVFAY